MFFIKFSRRRATQIERGVGSRTSYFALACWLWGGEIAETNLRNSCPSRSGFNQQGRSGLLQPTTCCNSSGDLGYDVSNCSLPETYLVFNFQERQSWEIAQLRNQRPEIPSIHREYLSWAKQIFRSTKIRCAEKNICNE